MVICWYLFSYAPSVINTIRCNKSTYYISEFHPFGDYQWIEFQLTKWDGVLKYNTFGFGYAPGAGPFEFVCDEENNGVNILSVYPNEKVLHYSYGKISRSYLHIIAQTSNHLYTVAEECAIWADTYCEVFIYTLYECNLDYTSCDALPVQYTSDYYIFGNFIINQATDEINFYDSYEDDATLIFAYGENPRCFVEGCEVLEP